MRVLERAARDRKLPPRDTLYLHFAQVKPGDWLLSTVDEYRMWHGHRVTEVEVTDSFCVRGLTSWDPETKTEVVPVGHYGAWLRFEGLPALQLCSTCIGASGLPIVKVERERE